MKHISDRFEPKNPVIKPRRVTESKMRMWARTIIRPGPNRQRADMSPSGGSPAPDDPSRIVKGVVIGFGAHIVVIALYFIHLNFLGGKGEDTTSATRTEPEIPAAVSGAGQRTEIITSGDTWATIAIRAGVDEARLREVNKGRPFENGRKLIIPDENLGTAPPPSSTESGSAARDAGLVDVMPEVLEPVDGDSSDAVVRPVPRGVVVEDAGKATAVKASGRTHKVKSGETVSKICARYKTDQRKLMELNGMKDPNKLKVGVTLKIPN